MDSPPLFAGLLDPEVGGRFTLEPAVPYEVQRRYVPDTNVLETTFVTGSGRVRVVDAVNRGVDEPLPWAELVREVSCPLGEVPMRWRVAPGTRLGRARPWAWRPDGTPDGAPGGVPLLRVGDQMAAVVTQRAGEAELGMGEVCGRFTAGPGAAVLVAVTVTDGMPAALPDPEEIRRRLRATEQAWRRWSSRVRYHGADEHLVRRSALVLKLLAYAPTGALTAAATTSLPETIGGEKNFDYRYGWVRDTSFALEALIELGLYAEAHGTLAWLLDAVSRTAPQTRPFYRLRGSVPAGETHPRLRGYLDSRPVRDGNQAVQQPQWGNYGDLLHSVWLAVDREITVLDPGTARMLEAMADRVCDVWSQPDSGIWELSTERHYTSSKLACWAALDRAIRLAERGQLAARDVARWTAERAAIGDWVNEHCWSEVKQAYSFYAGSDDLDAAVLLAARMGFVSGDDPRYDTTIDAVRAELADGPLVYRYSGAKDEENAFLLCSFWLVDALVRADRAEEARELWKDLIGYAGDLGVLSEQLDPNTGEARGNLPQALSHLSLIIAACRLHRARPPQDTAHDTATDTADMEDANGG